MIEPLAAIKAAIAEARRAQGPCHPNPPVGAVVVHRGTIVASGHTQPPGGPHAEVEALRAFAATGLVPEAETTLYVTLEPCCTHGRTPPCTEAIIASGIRRVVVGATDPNPRHAGRGFDRLREAGVSVEVGVAAAACEDLSLPFHYAMRTGRPLWAGKSAITLDGKIATRTGHSQWITGPAARQDVARWRRAFPAIAVGGGTVVADDPALTARVDGDAVWCPRRLIFDRAGRALARPDAQVFSDAWAARTVYLTSAAVAEKIPLAWKERGVEVWTDLGAEALDERCLAEGINGVYAEGGAGLLSSLLAGGQLAYWFVYRAPVWLGDAEAPGPLGGFSPETMTAAFSLRDPVVEIFDRDVLTRGWIVRPEVGGES